MSVIVTTRNSAEHLKPLLESILQQTHSDLELVVVDNASVDGTREIAGQYADRVLDAGPERSAQRNRGVEAATGEFVLIVDADMILDADVVAECLHEANTAGAAAVVVPERSVGNGFWAECKALERSCYEGDETIEAARFFRRESFLRHGGYDEGLTGPEDWDLPARMREAGETTARADRALIVHVEGRLRLRTLALKKFYYGRSLGPYLRRHRALAVRQVPFLRLAFARHGRRLAARPRHAFGLVIMKGFETTAALLGMASGAAARRR